MFSGNASLGGLAIERRAGYPVATTFGDAFRTAVQYSEYGEPSLLEAYAGVSLLYGWSNVVRDLAGRVLSEDEITEGELTHHEYTYDGAGRLATVRRDGSVVSTYAYDANGNRLTHATADGAEQGVYGAGDQLLAYGPYDYSYDERGRLASRTHRTSGEVTRFTYEAMGGLTRVELPNGSLITYDVDAGGKRFAKRVNGVTTRRWLHTDGLRPVAELDGSNVVRSRFVYADRANVPTLIVQGSAVYRVVADLRGSVRLVVDVATGNVVQRMDYDESGRVLADTNPGFQPFGFAGGLYDPDTSLVRFGVRDYDPTPGRWTARDPILFGGGDTNLYAYVGNDPINVIDPSGRLGILATGGIGAGIGFIAGGIAAVGQNQSFWGGAVAGALSGWMIGTGGAIALVVAEGGGAAGGALAAYLAAGNGATASLLGQAVQQKWEYTFHPPGTCSNGRFEFKPSLEAAAASGVLAGATLGLGAAVGAGASQFGTRAEIASEAAWNWATGSLDMAAGTYYAE